MQYQGMFLPKALYWGHSGARENFALRIRNIVEAGYRSLGECPVIIGECGIPMDMKLVALMTCAVIVAEPSCSKGEAFKEDKWHWQARMMDAMLTALDRALVGFTYVYCTDSRRRG